MSDQATAKAGQVLAERLGLTIIGTEGHDLKTPCVSCQSSDAGRVHTETGVFFCYSCQKALSAFDLCKVVLRDQHQAKRVMIEAGLFRDLGHVGNSNGQAAVSGSRKPSDNEIIDLVARHKGTTGDGFQAYGAVVKNGNVVFPTYRLADGKAKLVSSFYIDPKNPNDMPWSSSTHGIGSCPWVFRKTTMPKSWCFTTRSTATLLP